MFLSLLCTVFLMGLAGIPHCATMCATPCAAALPQGVSPAVLAGRALGYGVLGAVAASATGVLAGWSRWAGALQPVWVMLLTASVLLGIWMVMTGAMPPSLQRHGTSLYRRLQHWAGDPALARRHRWLRPLMPALLGAVWAALPCGLLYGAVVVAALAGNPWEGAALMMVFSLPGAAALWWLPRRLRVWAAAGGPPGGGALPRVSPGRWGRLADPRWATRLSGGVLAAAAAWALSHRLLAQWQVWCA